MKNGKAQTGGRLAGFLKKNNMVLLLACGGVLLILFASTLFGGSGQEEQPAAFASETLTNEQVIAQTEQKLQNILNGISGVERCEVMITLETGIEYRYATDETDSTTQNGNTAGDSVKSESSRDTETKIGGVKDKTTGERALIVTEIYPDINGVAVICEGSNTPTLKLSIIETVSTVLGIKTSQVCVIMKG